MLVMALGCNISFTSNEMMRKEMMFTDPNSPVDSPSRHQKSHKHYEQATLCYPPPRKSLLKKDQALTIIFGAI